LKILVIRFSSIGDIVLCTPVIRACKEQLSAEVHLLTKSKFRNVIANNKNIDHIYSFESHLSELKSALKGEEYDYIIDLHNNLRSRQVKLWLNTPSGTFPKQNINKWILVNTKIDRLPDLHIVDRYFLAFDKIKNDGKGLDYFVRKENHVDLSLGPFVSIVLGATYYTKRIPASVVASILTQLKSDVVLIGGPEEEKLGEELSQGLAHVTNACGKYNLDQSASIISQSKAVITSDTGMMHIAAAVKKRVFMMWGNTVPAFGMGPYKTKVSHYEVEGLNCRPCSKLGKAECPKGHFKCMLNQDIDKLLVELYQELKLHF
jgi:ADP-heptose:LPS heptosyltransferase